MTAHDLALEGHGILLTPAVPDDAAAAWALTDASLWAGMTTPWPESVAAYAARIAQQQATPGMFAFMVRDADTLGIRGSTTFYEYAPTQGRVEIGTTWYGRAFQGGRTNPATKLLLLRHAFEQWGLNRVALRCDARNTRSARAIERLGATPEGRLRHHRIASDGSIGDTLYFSILREEWPNVRAGLEARLR
ncbi:RimJ/RimL family protein N-acetyltransferase [Microbacterium sp. SORGH_AS 1204]|uniref:GNAT family N-acetyltransferase n=1 Tax=Microbacterium sp. SORGH_AS_1204 TaxID=3041785 RepID=UPI00278D050C|nr:GNAT family protein [Microbacterium sp. SORGH_AS_1204]MDQ1136079.1 RimJ/RimL family protein N-acetyltransferase [Microbacterium sp. SORGH_AS_1204]